MVWVRLSVQGLKLTFGGGYQQYRAAYGIGYPAVMVWVRLSVQGLKLTFGRG